jgi:hypothetical protein
MNSAPNDHQINSSDVNALQALRSLPLPEGMQDRITERVRQRQLESPARGLRRYMWELWLGASIAAVTAAAIFCIVALQVHRTASPPVTANMPAHTVIPTPASTNTQTATHPPRKVVHSYRAKQSAPEAPIPHTPPPMPLTAQERLLLELARSPLLAAGVVQTQTISQHGLGNNALFELDHEQLQPMRTESKLLQPLPPLPHNLP